MDYTSVLKAVKRGYVLTTCNRALARRHHWATWAMVLQHLGLHVCVAVEKGIGALGPVCALSST